MKRMINVADLVDQTDPEGRTFRQINEAQRHNIPVGALVEVEPSEDSIYKNGIRLFVVYHVRDCDGSPLYALSADPNDTVMWREHFYNHSWLTGFSEESLRVIELPTTPQEGP